ncbi:MAG: MAPEG family protein [Alphaproteobacteria bacterium]|nr:MAPEG family protein [Alphaproteobacteria bacterium]MCL2505269.1 MAPEG family protein [Alphaproteobacteria bacterium]
MPVYVSLLYIGIAGLLLLVLSFNMTKCWVRSIGTDNKKDQVVFKRAEGLLHSFTDYVPIIFLLMISIEANGAPPYIIHVMGITLIIARLMHAFGSNFMTGADAIRFLGAQITYLLLTFSSFCALFYYMLPKIVQAN